MRLAIISDIHEDILALEKVFRQIRKKGCDLLACLGDISGAGSSMYEDPVRRNAPACLDLIRANCDIVLPGNHDMHAAERFPQYDIGFVFPAEWYTLDISSREKKSLGKVWLHDEDLDPGYTTDSIEYLRSLPEFAIIDAGPFNVLLSHYIYPDLAGFLSGFRIEGTEFRHHFNFMERQDCRVAFHGHSHPDGFTLTRPGSFTIKDYGSMKLEPLPWIVGVPPVTGFRQRTGFCIFDTSATTAEFIKVGV